MKMFYSKKKGKIHFREGEKHMINARKKNKSMSRDQGIPLSRKAGVTRLRKELSR